MNAVPDPTKQMQVQALRIINRFGGLAKAARAWDKAKSTLQRWKAAGFIHPDYYPTILDAAVNEGVLLDPADFVLVDVSHPAFNAPRTPSADSTADRASRSDQRPTPDIARSLEPCEAGASAVPAAGDVSEHSLQDPSEVRA